MGRWLTVPANPPEVADELCCLMKALAGKLPINSVVVPLPPPPILSHTCLWELCWTGSLPPSSSFYFSSLPLALFTSSQSSAFHPPPLLFQRDHVLLHLSGPLTFYSALLFFFLSPDISSCICFTIIYAMFNLHLDHVEGDEPCFRMIIFRQNAET